jgi:hypothetical protein
MDTPAKQTARPPPPRARAPPLPRAHLTRAVDEWCTDATTGGTRPTRENALRFAVGTRQPTTTTPTPWAMGDGSCAPLAAALAGDVLRTAAYTPWKAARKAAAVGVQGHTDWRRTGGPAAGGGRRRRSARGGRRRQRQTRRDCSPHNMTAPRRRVATSSPRPLVQQPGPR